MSIYDKASLVLIPSGTKTSKVYSQKPVNGDGDFTFSRSTAATRVNADGNIEKETQNLLVQSNNFDTTWQIGGAGTITENQAGYDGTNNASLITKTAAWTNVNQNINQSGVQTYSVYVKANASNWALLVADHPSTDPIAYFDLTNGVVGSTTHIVDTDIVDVGNDWWRISITYNMAISQVRVYPAESNTASGTSGSIYIQDAQLEQGLVARDVLTTTTAAVEGGITDNVPRLDYTDSSCPALLLEPQRTNAMTYSEGLNIGLGINYKSAGVTLTPNDAESPEGYNNATKFDGGLNDIADTYIGYTASTTNTFSAFLKAGTCDIAKMRHTATGSTSEITINLTSGTITNTTGAQYLDSSIVDYGNGWYRASITFTSGTTAYITRVQLGEAGYIHMYGWQIERGASYATSYIPTYGTSVTRNAEDPRLSGVDALIGQTQGTLFLEYDGLDSVGGNVWMNVAGETSFQDWIFVGQSGTQARAYFKAGNTIINNWQQSQNDGVNKIAMVYKPNSIKVFIDGELVDTHTGSWTFSQTMGKIELNAGGTAVTGQGAIRQSLLLPTALTDQEAIDLTTI